VPEPSRRAPLPLAALAALVIPLAATSSSPDGSTEPPVPASSLDETGTTVDVASQQIDGLYQSARAEGRVNLIGVPPDWVNYDDIIAAFAADYPGVTPEPKAPDSSAADQLAAVEAQAGTEDMPDVLDIAPTLDVDAIDPSPWAPYQPTVWDDVPAILRGPDDEWVSSYFGVVAIATNADVLGDAPATFAQLRDPAYAGLVTLTGDPTEDAAAFAVVMAASLANGGSLDDVMPGIEYFADLRAGGILADPPTEQLPLDPVATPVVLGWSYDVQRLAASGIPDENGDGEPDAPPADLRWVVPTDGIYGASYDQGVVAEGPHPNAGRLWIEHMLSLDTGRLLLAGGAIPARIQSLAATDGADLSVLGGLSPDELIAMVRFATPQQVAAALEVVVENWAPMVTAMTTPETVAPDAT
jgi:putative spermidine/putrescine transport system substrate-binding protein